MEDRLRQLMTLGREHYLAREYDKAEALLTQVVEEHQGFADVFNMLGVIYHEHGRFTEAETSFENALRINPNYTEAALNLSVTCNDLGKYDRAREIYSQAIARTHDQAGTLDPFARGKLANMHAELGEAYASIGFYGEAVREYRNALELCPTFVDLRTRLAGVYRDMGDYEHSMAEFAQIKLSNPDYLPARIAHGVTLFSLGRLDEAIAEWRAVLAQDGNNRTAAAYLRMVQRDGDAPRPGSAVAVEPLPVDASGEITTE